MNFAIARPLRLISARAARHSENYLITELEVEQRGGGRILNRQFR